MPEKAPRSGSQDARRAIRPVPWSLDARRLRPALRRSWRVFSAYMNNLSGAGVIGHIYLPVGVAMWLAACPLWTPKGDSDFITGMSGVIASAGVILLYADGVIRSRRGRGPHE
jgi:hypothetical protein